MAIACVWATYSSAVQKIEWPLFQLFARLAPVHSTDAKVAVIAIDEKSIKTQGEWPWHSRQLRALTKPLSRYKGQALVWLPPVSKLNTLDPQRIKSLSNSLSKKDRKKFLNLIRSLDDKKNVSRLFSKVSTLHMTMQYTPESGIDTRSSLKIQHLDIQPTIGSSTFDRLLDWVHRAPQDLVFVKSENKELLKSAKKSGLVPEVSNGKLLQEPLILEIGQHYYPSAMLQVLAALNGTTAEKVQYIAGEGVRIGGQLYKTDSAFNVVPRIGEARYSGSIVPVYSAADVIKGKVKVAELSEFDVVVVGTTMQDRHPVVYTGEQIPYPVWFANAINVLIQDNMIEQPFGVHVIQRGLILILALYLMFLPLRLRGYVGLGFSAFLAVVLVNVIFFSIFLYSSWLKITIPVVFLLFGHLVVVFHFKLTMAFKSLQLEAANAYRELALNEQTQGNLDKAFAYMRKCPMDKKLLECLYNLGIEFESRRQFRQAVAVYEYISRKDVNYRDIQERKTRHQTVSNPGVLARSSAPNTAATLVVDHPNVARPVLGRYQIEKIVGQGAMGTVYMGVDPKIGRTVAIKTLALSEEFEPKQLEDVRRRFFREAETAGRLNHPKIVTIYDVGEEHDLAYIAMDFITGEGLDNFVQGESLLTIDEVFQIGVDVAEALDYAHSQNVVHRDVKPANIIYDPDTQAVKVTDFGIACLTDTSKTRTGTIMGSPSYMSPEQLEGTHTDGRSDLYSLGVTLYQLFTAALPFTADSMTSLAYKIVKDKPKGVRQVRSELPVCLSRVINKSLEKDPDSRYQSGADFAKALRKCGGL